MKSDDAGGSHHANVASMRFLIKAEVDYAAPEITSPAITRAIVDGLAGLGSCAGVSTAVVSPRDYALWLLAHEDLGVEQPRVRQEFGADVARLVDEVCRLRVALRCVADPTKQTV